VRPLLQRGAGGPQSGASAATRRSNPHFLARTPVRGSVLVVDDVATTGATLTAAARALRSAGAEEIHAVVVARAPKPS
ncbi:MAG TPA: phosphoribosyltransferase family protein, partial [Acidimicrobiales bacterium]